MRWKIAFLASALAVAPGLTIKAQSQARDPRVAANPLLAAVEQKDQRRLPDILKILDSIEAGRSVGSRTGVNPSVAEASEITINPALSRAFDRNPAYTISLLRRIHEIIDN
jgi:hypothetical protein